MSEEYIGKPSYGNEKKRANAGNANWRIDTEGSHPYRVLPPFGLLAPRGQWAKYEAIHWGFSASNGKQRPFRCIRRTNHKTKKVEVECPMCLEIEKHMELRKSTEERLKNEGKTKPEIVEKTKALTDWLRKFNLQKAFFLNVMRPDGQIGRLSLKVSHKQALDREIQKIITEEGMDPILASEGVLLDFQRVGTGFNNTEYAVARMYELVESNGRKLKAVKSMPLTEDILARMKTEAFELTTGYRELTHDEISMLVGSGADPSIVDSIFGAPKLEAKAQADSYDDSAAGPPDEDYSASSGGTANSEAALVAALNAKSRSSGSSRPPVDDSAVDDFLSKYK